MAPSDLRRPYKRPQLSDQQRRRELSLKRQEQSRDAGLQAKRLASTLLSLPPEHQPSEPEPEPETEPGSSTDYDLRDASKLKGPAARKWFAKQLMLPEWMIDVPHRLPHDWYVLPRPSGKRCFVVSSDGTTISRQRNGTVLHRFPSALPHGSRNRDGSGPPSYSILDCIFHEMDQTYYVIDMVCWKNYSYYNCSTEFRFTWLEEKLRETNARDAPSYYHKYRFSLVPWGCCDLAGLHEAYAGEVPFVKDGLLFYNKHAHYQPGNTPLALVWKDEHCSQYVIDTDNKGQVPSHQQVVLELQDDGKVTTSDDPPVVFGCLNLDFIQQSGLKTGCLLRFAIGDGGLTIVDGKLERADLHYLGMSNRARAFADTCSKIMFQSMARGSPLRIDDLVASINSSDDHANSLDVEMTV
ncbi:PREDICTED: snurportin-1 [Fragaria vesca subsp. vesca]|uniref:snurportin-1 n=1 Tax=Fragaria vesca subsp. vesca TaxID=101020 RepID=UPI0002C3197B|nr:PREDICTED: snurportin-1 [Fragaria vesca subsp. vesca]